MRAVQSSPQTQWSFHLKRTQLWQRQLWSMKDVWGNTALPAASSAISESSKGQCRILPVQKSNRRKCRSHGIQVFLWKQRQDLFSIRCSSDLSLWQRTVTSFHCSKLLLECQTLQGISQKIFLVHSFLSNTPLLQEEHVQVYFFELYLDL